MPRQRMCLVRQASLAWPGIEETCPKCHGERHVYNLHAGQPGVEVVGGKRVACPVCAGTGSVRTPLSSTPDPSSEARRWGPRT